MSSTSPSVTQDSPTCTECSSPSIEDNCYPLSSSTVVLSSPLLRTPAESPTTGASDRLPEDSAAYYHDIAALAEDVEAWFQTQAMQSRKVSLRNPPQNDSTNASYLKSEESCASVSSGSNASRLEQPKNMAPTHEDVPHYYSLESHAAQADFSRHLDELLLAVLEERILAATRTTSVSCLSTAVSSQTGSLYAVENTLSRQYAIPSLVSPLSPSSTLPPHAAGLLLTANRTESLTDTASSRTSAALETSTPMPCVSDFIYVQVDEHSDDSQLCNDSGSPSASSQISPSSQPSPDTESCELIYCHPSTLTSRSIHTPLSAHAITMPQAPRKVTHNYEVRSSSPIRAPQSHQNQLVTKSADEAKSHDSGLNCMPAEMTCRDQSSQGGAYNRRKSMPRSEAPQIKRRKLSSPDAVPSTLASRFLATEPASLRRAASLRSEASVVNLLGDGAGVIRATTQAPAAHTPMESPRPDTLPERISCPPTQVSTPDRRRRFRAVTPSNSPLPLIAPPAYELIPCAPLSVTDFASLRIASLINKTFEERCADGLAVSKTVIDLEFKTTISSSLHSKAVIVKDEPEDIILADRRGPSEASVSDGDEDLRLGIRESFRMKVVQWILDVMPPTFRSKPNLCSNLRSQLLESPDSRWHAAHMFTRYFLRMGVSPSSSPVTDERRKTTENDDQESSRVLHGKEALTWDLAVACMALAVKFHRDVLPPLYPVTASEFLILAPHTMEYDDLESAQRDLLSALSFCVGSHTPAAYMEELWLALPSLRSLIEKRGNWQVTKTETWELLYDTLMDVAYLNYPVHVLTGCALILGAIESLVITMKGEEAEKMKSLANGTAPRTKRREGACNCAKLLKKARKAIKNVEMDMCELLDVSADIWTKCMNWLQTVAEG